MLVVTEKELAALASHELAYEAVRMALADAVNPATVSFPVVLGHGSDPDNRFTVKSGAAPRIAGLKVGSYWPGNPVKGLPRHNSTIFLFDQSTGRITAAVEAGALNAYRTAAADAVATDALARSDAARLALFGTGHQALYEVEAVSRIRRLTEILVVGRSSRNVDNIVSEFKSRGLPARPSDAEAACKAADIIVTVTTATSPLFEAAWVSPGTHISSMGSDRIGKQELPPELFETARLFCDLPEQSRSIGEFQHVDAGIDVIAVGDVLSGKKQGRTNGEEITIFDSSGLAIQDLYVAKAILSRCAGVDDRPAPGV